MTVSPAKPGANVLHLYFFDSTSRLRSVDVADATVVSGDLPPRRIPLLPLTPSHFSADAFSLPTPGLWKFSVRMVERGLVMTTAFEVEIR